MRYFEGMQPIFVRRSWLALLIAPLAILAEGEALATGSLPHGIHLGRNGRYYQDVCDRDADRHCFASRLLSKGYIPQATPQAAGFCSPDSPAPAASAPAEGSMGPKEVVAAYSLPSSSAAHGKIVAVVEMPDSTVFADLTNYRAAYNLPVLPKCTGNGGLPDGTTPCFAAVDQTGAAYTATSSTDCVHADPETSLDVDMISAACPDCSILVVQMTKASRTDGPTDQDFIDCTTVAATLGAQATSISFGGPEEINGADPIGYTTPGHLVLAASGDQGYLLEGAGQGYGTSPSYPASAPDVVGVGGTMLEAKSGGGYGEVVWNDAPTAAEAAGSGCSVEFARPAFQTAFGATKFGPSCTKRASSDVSAAASFAPASNPTGQGGAIAEYDTYNTWVQVEGTSASAPLVAAILVRLGIANAVSNDIGFLYTNIAAFNDVTSGTSGLGNQTLCPANDVICNAAAGWDGPTGVGTPNGSKLALLGTPTSVPDAGKDNGDDSGAGLGDSGAVTVADDAGSVSNGFTTTNASSGCSCTAPGTAPLENAGALAALGALALFGARRRRR